MQYARIQSKQTKSAKRNQTNSGDNYQPISMINLVLAHPGCCRI